MIVYSSSIRYSFMFRNGLTSPNVLPHVICSCYQGKLHLAVWHPYLRLTTPIDSCDHYYLLETICIICISQRTQFGTYTKCFPTQLETICIISICMILPIFLLLWHHHHDRAGNENITLFTVLAALSSSHCHD